MFLLARFGIDEQQNLFKYKTVQSRKFNFELNLRINRSIVCTSLGDPRSVASLTMVTPGRNFVLSPFIM